MYLPFSKLVSLVWYYLISGYFSFCEWKRKTEKHCRRRISSQLTWAMMWSTTEVWHTRHDLLPCCHLFLTMGPTEPPSIQVPSPVLLPSSHQPHDGFAWHSSHVRSWEHLVPFRICTIWDSSNFMNIDAQTVIIKRNPYCTWLQVIGTVYPNSSLQVQPLIYFQDSVSWHLPKSYKEHLVTVHVLQRCSQPCPNARPIGIFAGLTWFPHCPLILY